MQRHHIGLLSLLAVVTVLAAGCSKANSDSAVSDPYARTTDTSRASAPLESTPSSVTNSFISMPTSTLDQTKTYTAILKTDKGDIEIALTGDKTPITVNNFVTLAQKGFYNGTIFHRTIEGFMIQGGDPTGTGTGGPGYKFDDEPFDGEYTKGTVAMANAGPNTNGSQFFIMQADVPLPKNYVIFGRVTKGLDVVDAIATAPVMMSPSGEDSQPVTPVKIQTATIEVKNK